MRHLLVDTRVHRLLMERPPRAIPVQTATQRINNLTINSNTYGAGFYGNFIGQSFTTNVLTKRVAMRTFDLETGTFK